MRGGNAKCMNRVTEDDRGNEPASWWLEPRYVMSTMSR